MGMVSVSATRMDTVPVHTGMAGISGQAGPMMAHAPSRASFPILSEGHRSIAGFWQVLAWVFCRFDRLETCTGSVLFRAVS
jgi:hypothetical protein